MIWISPPVPGARHDADAATAHSLPSRLEQASIIAYADTDYTGTGPMIRTPFRRVRRHRATGKFVSRKLSENQKAVNRSIAAMCGPGERANADLKNWQTLRKIRSSPAHATLLVNAVQVMILNS